MLGLRLSFRIGSTPQGSLRIRLQKYGKHSRESKSKVRKGAGFLHLMYYLLGFMVGDIGKNFSANLSMARLQLDLCRKHRENLALGTFVFDCVRLLGIPYTRIADSSPRKGEPHGLYRWVSYFSEAFAWVFT